MRCAACSASATRAAVRIVKRLEDGGLVAREPDPADRRAVRLHLTRDGQREARRLLAARQAALTPLLAGLGERESAALERLLERLLARATGSAEDANRICRLCDPVSAGTRTAARSRRRSSLARRLERRSTPWRGPTSTAPGSARPRTDQRLWLTTSMLLPSGSRT